MCNKQKKSIPVILAVVLSIAVLLFTAACDVADCIFVPDSGQKLVEFYKSDFAIIVGEQREFSQADFYYTDSAMPQGKLRVTDSKTASVSGMTVTGLEIGKTKLTFSASDGRKETVATVHVVNDIESLSLITRGNLAYEVGQADAVDVYAVVGDGKVSAGKYDIVWTLNDTVLDYRGGVLSIDAPNEPVNYKVEASVLSRAGKIETEPVYVYFYEPFVLSPVLTEVEDSPEPLSAAPTFKYALNYELTEDSPEPLVEWFVNGERDKNTGDTFTFMPNAPGKYSVAASVNGVAADCDGAAYFDAVVSGAVIPTKIEVDVERPYPDMVINFIGGDETEIFEAVVTTAAGAAVGTYRSKGDGFSITVPGNDVDILRRSYEVKVRSLGSADGVFEESAFCTPVKLSAFVPAAAEYIQNKTVFNPALNHYVSSDEEFYELFDYYMLYRGDGKGDEGSVEFKVYFGYALEKDIRRLCNEAFNLCNYTGMYSIGATFAKPIAKITIEFNSVSAPDKANDLSGATWALNAVTPAVSDKADKDIDEAGLLPIDGREKPVTVVTTDQLYRAAEQGYRPEPQEGSMAETVYAYARGLLNTITDESMDETETALALYDWIMWRTSYDNAAVSLGSSDVKTAVRYGAFYIEGVFGLIPQYEGESLAVCDGISKTYSLLANMAGLEALRITGTAAQDSQTENHAWNKVKIDGEWYIVDATWGDCIVDFKGSVGKREIASREYFLLTDAEVDTHTENGFCDYPATAVLPVCRERLCDIYNAAGGFYEYVRKADGLSAATAALGEYLAGRLALGSTMYDDRYTGTSTSAPFAGAAIVFSESAHNELDLDAVTAALKTGIKGAGLSENDVFFIYIGKTLHVYAKR